MHLILADGAKLTATGSIDYYDPGIQVSGEGNSLTIYGQTNQSGQLIADGRITAAGIGGGNGQDGSNITINGGSNITITGGFVTAVGYRGASGIGKGEDAADGPGKIYVATRCIVKAGDSENPTDVIENDGNTNLTSQLNDKNYVTVVYDLIDAYNNGYTAGDAAGYIRAKNELPTDAEGTEGPAVVVTKGRKSVTLINPDKVNFIKVTK